MGLANALQSMAVARKMHEVSSQFKAVVAIQFSTTSVSLIASSAMAFMIVRTRKCLSTPYRRIIFAMSIADILVSIGILAGPFSVPSDIPSSWGIGNDGTCQASGFLIILGVNLVPNYLCFLCWYYFCKLKYRMTNDEFAERMEWKFHIINATFTLAMASAALGLQTINPTFMKTTCQTAATPSGCKFYPETVGECDQNIEDRVDAFVVLYVVLKALCLVFMIVIMSMLYWHVITQNRIFQPNISPSPSASRSLPMVGGEGGDVDNGRNDKSRSETEVNLEEDGICTNDGPERHPIDSNQQPAYPSQAREKALYLSSLYRSEIALQGTLYVVVYCLIYIPTIIVYGFVIFSAQPPRLFQILAFVVTPLGGLFMILVYTRPQIAHLQRENPDRSRLCCLWLVVKAGGEIPEEGEPPDASDDANGHCGDPGTLRLRRLRQIRKDLLDEESISSVQIGATNIARERRVVEMMECPSFDSVGGIHASSQLPCDFISQDSFSLPHSVSPSIPYESLDQE